MITFNCPHCQQSISAESSDAGLVANCPACGEIIEVPSEVLPTAEANGSQPTGNAEPEFTAVPNGFADRMEETPTIPPSEASVLSRITTGAKAGWCGVKRNSRIAALNAQIEKLKNVDLRMAHHALGKKCLESEVTEGDFLELHQSIRALDTRISEMREKVVAESIETKVAAMKRMGRHATNAGHAQALTMKREHLITELGRHVHARASEADVYGMQKEFQMIAAIQEQIHNKAEDAGNLGNTRESRISTIALAAALLLFIAAMAITGLKMLGGKEQVEEVEEVSYSPPAPSTKIDPDNGLNSISTGMPEPENEDVLPLPVPQWFPPDAKAKATLNNVSQWQPFIRSSPDEDGPADRSLCEVYIRGYLFPHTLVAFSEAGYPGLPRREGDENNRLTAPMSKMVMLQDIGGFDRDSSEKPIPRWFPNDRLPSQTRREIYEEYFGFPISDEQVEITNKEWDVRDSFKGTIDLIDPEPVSESDIRLFLEEFDRFKTKLLKTKNALPPGTHIWEPWMRNFHDHVGSDGALNLRED